MKLPESNKSPRMGFFEHRFNNLEHHFLLLGSIVCLSFYVGVYRRHSLSIHVVHRLPLTSEVSSLSKRQVTVGSNIDSEVHAE